MLHGATAASHGTRLASRGRSVMQFQHSVSAEPRAKSYRSGIFIICGLTGLTRGC